MYTKDQSVNIIKLFTKTCKILSEFVTIIDQCQNYLLVIGYEQPIKELTLLMRNFKLHFHENHTKRPEVYQQRTNKPPNLQTTQYHNHLQQAEENKIKGYNF